ncbi:MAG: hypothetical protein HC888_11705, partial [Candidatus Competibacteraceae bacterium]|nr:hypothetical protein [Candidatus Competibacteraceae bacterium]
MKATIGAGKTGTEIRKALRASPFGWPQDAVDAALLALHRAQHVSATLNGAAVAWANSTKTRLPRRIPGRTGHVVGSGPAGAAQAVPGAEPWLQERRGKRQGGGVPEGPYRSRPLGPAANRQCPAAQPNHRRSRTSSVQVGNAQLLSIKAKAADWEKRITEWTGLRDGIAARLPGWGLVERLARHAAGIMAAKPHLDQVQAIRDHRMLLEPSDPANTVRLALGGLLRDAVQKAKRPNSRPMTTPWRRWPATTPGPGSSRPIRTPSCDVGLMPPTKADVSTDQVLTNHLDARPLSSVQAEI